MRSTRFLGFLLAGVLATFASGQTITSAYPPVIGYVDLTPAGTGLGTAIAGVGDDTTHGIVTTVGNGLFPAGSVTIGNNGVLSAAAGGSGPITNAVIAATGVPTGLTAAALGVLLPHWDDLYPNPNPSSTTLYWYEAAGVLYVQWNMEDHFSAVTQGIGENITFQVQVFSAPGPGTPWIQFLYPDVIFGGSVAALDNGASATVGYAKCANTLAANTPWSFNTPALAGVTVLSIFPPMLLTFTSPLGPGSIQADIDAGPPLGTYFMCVTLNAGTYPNGFFFGISPSFQEIVSEATGWPFVFGLDASGHYTVGPFPGVPSGLTIYGVALGFDTAVLDVPSLRSGPKTYTVP